jgi:hypothetical protein
MRILSPLCLTLLALTLLIAPGNQASANVFAHNIRITQPASDAPFDAKFSDGTGAGIRFVLSDRADSVVVNIFSGATMIRTLRGTNFVSGDTMLVWDGMNAGGVAVGTGEYTVNVTAFDKGYSTYTEIFYDMPAIFTRGVTTIKNPDLKNFGFIYSADNGGYATGVARHSADGRQWGNSKGVAKLNNTGAVVGPLNLRYSSEADETGFVYLIGRDKKEIYRYHTDSMDVALYDSGGYTTNLEGVAVAGEGSGRVMAVAANRFVYFMPVGDASGWFQPKQVALDGDSTVIFWDVTFGDDSTIFATFYGAKDDIRPGVAKFDFSGWSGTSSKKLSDAEWTVTVDSGRGNTLALDFGRDPLDTDDVLYFTIARRKSGDANVMQNIYVVKNLYSGTPSLDTAYVDKQNNMTPSRSDIAVDAVGNIVYFENSNEETVVISPPTGPNSFMTNGKTPIRVIISETIAAVRRSTVDPYKPDRVGDTVTVIGTVASINPTASANRFSYFIQDETGGINITKSVTGGGTTHNIGHRLVVRGYISQFRGTTQLNIINYPADVTLLDSGNIVTPKVITMDTYLADPETYESQLIKINGVAKTATSVDWPAEGADANMTIWDGFRQIVLRIDQDTDIDGKTEPVYPMNVQGIATQYTSAGTVYNDGYQISPSMYTDFTGGINSTPNPNFSLLAPAHTSRIVLNDTAQTVTFRWNAAVDLNGDNVIYQWSPVGFSSVPTTNAARDTFLVRTGKQLLTYLATSDSVNLKWLVAAKDPTHAAIGSKDTLTVKLVRGTITDVNGRTEIPAQFALDQNYPNPFNPSTTIRFGLPSAASVRLTVYDALGREVRTLLDQEHAAGYVTVTWDGVNNSGVSVSSGIYFYRIQAQPAGGAKPFVELKKMMLLK